eukprot:g14824.t1
MFGGTPQIGGSHSSSVYPANTPSAPPSATKGQHQQHHQDNRSGNNHYSNHMLVSPQPLKLNQTGPTLLQSRRSNRHTAHGGMLGANIYQPDFRGGGSGGSACGAPANGTVAAADQHRPGSAVGVHQVHQSQSGHVQLQQQPQAGPLANGMSPDLRSRGLAVGGKMHYGGATSSTNPRVGGGGGGHLNATSPMTGAAMGAGALTAGGQRAELARQLGESEAKNADLRRQIDEMLEQKKLSEQKNNEITSILAGLEQQFVELQRDVDKYKETASQATKEKIRTQQSLDNLKDDKRKTVRQEQDNQRSLKSPLLIEIEENLQKAQNALALMERKNEALQDELRDCREQLRETSGDDAEQQRLATDLEVALNRINTLQQKLDVHEDNFGGAGNGTNEVTAMEYWKLRDKVREEEAQNQARSEQKERNAYAEEICPCPTFAGARGLEARERRIEELTDRLHEVEAESGRRITELEDLMDKAEEDHGIELKRMGDSAAAQLKQIDALEMELDSVQQEWHEKHERECEKLEEEKAELARELANVQHEKSSLMVKLTDEKKKIEQLSAESAAAVSEAERRFSEQERSLVDKAKKELREAVERATLQECERVTDALRTEHEKALCDEIAKVEKEGKRELEEMERGFREELEAVEKEGGARMAELEGRMAEEKAKREKMENEELAVQSERIAELEKREKELGREMESEKKRLKKERDDALRQVEEECGEKREKERADAKQRLDAAKEELQAKKEDWEKEKQELMNEIEVLELNQDGCLKQSEYEPDASIAYSPGEALKWQNDRELALCRENAKLIGEIRMFERKFDFKYGVK